MKKPLRGLVDYLILTFLASIAISLTLYFNGNKFYQLAIIVSFSAIYIIWGILHHLKEKTLRHCIILEYLLFAILGCVLVTSLLK